MFSASRWPGWLSGLCLKHVDIGRILCGLTNTVQDPCLGSSNGPFVAANLNDGLWTSRTEDCGTEEADRNQRYIVSWKFEMAKHADVVHDAPQHFAASLNCKAGGADTVN
mmetsp:Transcript_25532/g.60388  ORF Transcript_25532/g.60388 Transcript_25532/m.60388 type:complete len:110 (+) Transcript_25532:1528-1857(+)